VSGAARLEPSRVDLYYTDTRCVGEHGRSLLTPGDLERLSALATPRRRREYECGRALARFALERCTGRPARSHELRVTASGKPECADGTAISISHSAELVVCAVMGSGRLGADAQSPVPGRHTAEIAQRYFSAAEHAWLDSDPSGRFYMLWVLKEAYLKAVGVGIAGGLDLLTCHIEAPSITAAVARAGQEAHLALYSMGRAFVALASADRAFAQVRFDFWNPDGPVAYRPASPRLVAATAGSACM
jgi:phosphopantetheinyl transferase